MVRIRLQLLVAISILFFGITANAQTVSTGHEQAKAIVNFTDLAQYDLQHPQAIPAQPIEVENEDDEEQLMDEYERRIEQQGLFGQNTEDHDLPVENFDDLKEEFDYEEETSLQEEPPG